MALAFPTRPFEKVNFMKLKDPLSLAVLLMVTALPLAALANGEQPALPGNLSPQANNSSP